MGKGSLVLPPPELVTIRIKIECNTPGMHRPGAASAHEAHVQASAEQVESKRAYLINPIVIEGAGQNPQSRIMDFFVAYRGATHGACLPRKSHWIGKDKLGLILTLFTEEFFNITLPGPTGGLRRSFNQGRLFLLLVSPCLGRPISAFACLIDTQGVFSLRSMDSVYFAHVDAVKLAKRLFTGN